MGIRDIVTDRELDALWDDTRISRVGGRRVVLAHSILRVLGGKTCGAHITYVMRELKMIGNTGLRKRGREFIYEFFKGK